MAQFRYLPDRRLWLPVSAEPNAARAKASGYMREVIGWKDLFPEDEPASYDRLLALAEQLNLEGVLYLVSVLQMVMDAHHGLTGSAYTNEQLSAARELFPATIFERICYRMQTTTGDTVIHPEPLLIAALIALKHSRPGPRSDWSREVGAEFLLRLLDLFDITGGSSDTDSLLSLTLRRVGAMPKEEERYLLGRYFDLLVQRPRRKWGAPSRFDEIFTAEMGFTIDEYLAVGLILIHRFIGMDTVQKLLQGGFDAAVTSAAAQIAHLPNAKAIESQLVGDVNWYQSHHATRLDPDNLPMTNFEAFYDKPLVRLESGAIIPMSMTLILQRLTLGIYWMLFTSSKATEHGIKDMNSALGGIFQDYCSDALIAAYDNGHALAAPEADFEGNEGISKPDVGIVEGSAWIMVETTVSALRVGTLINGDVQGFRKEISDREHLGKKFRQPVIAAGNIVSGEVRHPRFVPDEVTDIFPVVLFLHPFPQHALTAREVGAAYAPPDNVTAPSGRPVRVHRLQFLTAEEMEVLEPMISGGSRLSELLATKEAADPFLAGGSMKNFLFSVPGWSEMDNSRMRVLLDDLRDACAPMIAGDAAQGPSGHSPPRPPGMM